MWELKRKENALHISIGTEAENERKREVYGIVRSCRRVRNQDRQLSDTIVVEICSDSYECHICEWWISNGFVVRFSSFSLCCRHQLTENFWLDSHHELYENICILIDSNRNIFIFFSSFFFRSFNVESGIFFACNERCVINMIV